jgi:hypothetical protein
MHKSCLQAPAFLKNSGDSGQNMPLIMVDCRTPFGDLLLERPGPWPHPKGKLWGRWKWEETGETRVYMGRWEAVWAPRRAAMVFGLRFGGPVRLPE